MELSARDVRARLSHPVIDADGHVLEYLPAVEPFLREALGSAAYERYRSQASPLARIMNTDEAAAGVDVRRASRTPQSAWWGTPARNTRDLATAVVPRLLYERMDELGIDFSVLYPTKGFGIAGIGDDELRQGVCRGFNEYFAAAYGPYADRLTVAATVPMHTPAEAIAGIEHAHRLGFKVIGLPEGVVRPIERPDPDNPTPFLMPGQTSWFDHFGLDSAYDYDPVWARARELGFAITFHGGLGQMPWQSYTSPTNYSYNHIGSFAQRMHHLVKSLVMGGVTTRFPDLNIAVLECGVGWAAILLADILGHFDKRGVRGLERLDPSTIDWDELGELFDHYGDDLLALAGAHDRTAGARTLPGTGVPPDERDEYARMSVSNGRDIVERFVPRLYFGCEADDRTMAYAFSAANPYGAQLQAIFSSDMGHWDAPDMETILGEAWEMVDEGVLSDEQFERFVFSNPARLFLAQNPHFFDGTPIESHVASVGA